MTTWLKKLLTPDLLGAYLERGYALNLGYAVSADPINPEDPAEDLVAVLDLDGPDGPLVGAGVIHTLRLPLLPTDTVYPVMGGTTDEKCTIARGGFLELPPFSGDGVVALFSSPQTSRLYVDPMILRVGAQILRWESGGAAAEVVATYRGLFMGWKKPDGVETSSGSPDPPSIQAFRVKEADSSFPEQLNFDEDGLLRNVIGLRRDNSSAQRRIVIEFDRIAQAGVAEVHGTWDGIPICTIRIIENDERQEIMPLAHGAYTAQERGMRHAEAGVYNALAVPHEALTTSILLSTPSWPQG